MKRPLRYISMFVVILIMLISTHAIGAQDEPPGNGGIIIVANTRGSANIGSFLPLYCAGIDCGLINTLIYPLFLAIDPVTQNFSPTLRGQGQVVNGWEISDDDLTYTFSLREDAVWNDGQPITALDFYFVWSAMEQGTAIGIEGLFEPLTRAIVSAQIIDDHTITFTLGEANCLALGLFSNLFALPAHIFGFEFDQADTYDWVQLIDHPYNTQPVVTSGPFNFERIDPGQAVYLSANPTWWDTNNGYVAPQGLIFLDTPDETVMIERFLTFREGEPNYVWQPISNFDVLRESDAQFYESAGTVWHYMALNTADPQNPHSGLADTTQLLSADNPPTDQGYHPLFGDVRVRQALQSALDIDEIINGALGGNATPMVTGTIPTAFTIHPTLERRPFNRDEARRLLDEAGFVSTGSPLMDGGDGLRTCQGCLYAEEGTPMRFVLNNPGGARNDVSVLVQAQLAQIGIDVEVAQLDFGAFYENRLKAQVFDAGIAGWLGSIPFDPDQRGYFGVEQDVVGTGFNFGSWTNPRYEQLGAMVNTVQGCDLQTRQEIAWEMQEILWEEQPYIFLYTLNAVFAAAPQVSGFAPYPNFGHWNIDTWTVEY